MSALAIPSNGESPPAYQQGNIVEFPGTNKSAPDNIVQFPVNREEPTNIIEFPANDFSKNDYVISVSKFLENPDSPNGPSNAEYAVRVLRESLEASLYGDVRDWSSLQGEASMDEIKEFFTWAYGNDSDKIPNIDVVRSAFEDLSTKFISVEKLEDGKEVVQFDTAKAEAIRTHNIKDYLETQYKDNHSREQFEKFTNGVTYESAIKMASEKFKVAQENWNGSIKDYLNKEAVNLQEKVNTLLSKKDPKVEEVTKAINELRRQPHEVRQKLQFQLTTLETKRAELMIQKVEGGIDREDQRSLRKAIKSLKRDLSSLPKGDSGAILLNNKIASLVKTKDDLQGKQTPL